MSKALLVTGASGKQGRALVTSLLASPQSSNFTILAVTRNPNSASAQSLLSLSPSTIKLVKGDFEDTPALFASALSALGGSSPQIHGVFSVQTAMGGGPSGEEAQGKAIVDEALKHNVKHFVYTSVDRGGSPGKSDSNPTNVPHFISKHNIETHLKEKTKAGTSGMTWTILRPVAFMDNLTPDFQGKIFPTAWQQLGGKRLQVIASSDIGWFAAQAFLNEREWKNREISLAGDELTYAEANAAFKKATGKSMPTTFGFVASGLLWAVKDMGLMFKWFQTDGYEADVSELRKINPKLMSFEEWVGQKSGFKV